ncbi:MAG: hypothetical protein GW771_13910 [Flavobacteriia bacterium]|nr:hypothetical protein [Flavobacteriia bacterium]
MKKAALFSMVIALSLMSFTKLKVEKTTPEELFSPECFETANTWTDWKKGCAGFEEYIDEYNYWVLMYEDCESQSNNDEFQFPPF